MIVLEVSHTYLVAKCYCGWSQKYEPSLTESCIQKISYVVHFEEYVYYIKVK